MFKNKLFIFITFLLLFILVGLLYFSNKNISAHFINTGNIFGNDLKKIIFVGDIMLDRAVAIHSKRDGKESVFEGVKYLFEGVDAVVGNLEGTVSYRKSIAVPGSSILRFTFDPSFMPILRSIGFKAVSLANNHSLDFGHDADTETRDYLHINDILTFGSALNDRDLSSSISMKDGAFCLVGYHDLFFPDPSGVIEEIKNIRSSCKNIVVFVHWGSEYTHVPSDRQRILAQSFIDIGADLVIGAHPHVVQPVEIYKGKAIFYSLGNFVFDQNFSFATMHGLIVSVEWANDQIRFELIPVSIEKGKVTVADGEARNEVLKTAIDKNTPKDIASSIINLGEFILK